MNKAILVSLLGLALLFAHSPRAFGSCSFAADLGYGSNGTEVYSLQNALQSLGYFDATANGNFGPLTLSSVKRFQAAKGIPATGYVGPLTRVALNSLACSSASEATPAPKPEPIALYGVSAPSSGESLEIGKSYAVAWSKDVTGDYSIVLEDKSGVAQGFITSNRSGGRSFVWKIGKVSANGSDRNVSPGTYRIRVYKTSQGISENDQTSAYFQIVSPGIRVAEILPSSVRADSTSAVVLYGSGFTSATFVYLDGIRNIQASRLYLSPDGKVIVFSIPEGVSPGTHYISLKSGYDSVENAGSIRIEE